MACSRSVPFLMEMLPLFLHEQRNMAVLFINSLKSNRYLKIIRFYCLPRFVSTFLQWGQFCSTGRSLCFWRNFICFLVESILDASFRNVKGIVIGSLKYQYHLHHLLGVDMGSCLTRNLINLKIWNIWWLTVNKHV